MGQRNRSAIDQQFTETISARAKLRHLIIARFGSLQAFAGAINAWPIHISWALTDVPRYRKELPEVRQKMAEGLGIPREEIDAALDEGFTAPDRKVAGAR